MIRLVLIKKNWTAYLSVFGHQGLWPAAMYTTFTSSQTPNLTLSNKTEYQHLHGTHIEHIASINVMRDQNTIRKGRIICTIGPASSNVEILMRMMEEGMNIARLNFSHGNYEYHLETLNKIRTACEMLSKKLNRKCTVGIALDTKGPEIRTGILKAGVLNEVNLEKGKQITITTNEKFAKNVTESMIYVDYIKMNKILTSNADIYIDDGLIHLKVLKIEGDRILCEIIRGGKLGSKKGVNLPGIDIDLPTLNDKDINDIKFAMKHNFDMIFASFVRNETDVVEIKKLVDVDDKASQIMVIAKIESLGGLENLDTIIKAADGLMVARGDLGIEMPGEKVFLAQKKIIAKCNLAGKPVICATQMLESMVRNPTPTRAESSDVANAILDGADCVMLSGETAKGKYPVECVRVMSKICQEAEATVPYRQLYIDFSKMVEPPASVNLSTALAGVAAAEKTSAACILAVTETGYTAQLVAKFRPHCPIIAITRDHRVGRKCHVFRGVIPVVDESKSPDWLQEIEAKIEVGLKVAATVKSVKEGDNVVVITAWKSLKNRSNTIRILTVTKEMLS